MVLDEINYLAVLAAIVVNMAIGGLWYSNLLFGKAWMNIVGLKEEDITNPGRAMFMAALLSILIAFFMAIIMQWVGPPDHGGSGAMQGLTIGLILWLGFSGPTIIMHLIFHQAPFKQFLINAGNYFVAYLAMGTVMGALQW